MFVVCTRYVYHTIEFIQVPPPPSLPHRRSKEVYVSYVVSMIYVQIKRKLEELKIEYVQHRLTNVHPEKRFEY